MWHSREYHIAPKRIAHSTLKAWAPQGFSVRGGLWPGGRGSLRATRL